MKSSKYMPNTSRGWFFSKIPSDWKHTPLKYACDITSQYGANIPAENYVDDGIRFLRTSDITDNGELLPGGVFIEPGAGVGYLLKERDILISRSGTIGRSFLYKDSYGACAYAGYLIRYHLKSEHEPRYLFYLTKSAGFQEWLGTVSIEATIGNVNGEKYANFSFPVPTFDTQRLIADYLDRETARIDALVAEKEKMLALLEEKRAALISRAVTRGLDPEPPLKPSGLDWLGDIPEHWDVRRLKFVTESLDQGSSPVAANTPAGPDELGILKLSAVNKGRFSRDENKALRESDDQEQVLSLRKGDVLITRGNTPDLVADVACVPCDEPNLLLPDLIYRLRVREDQVLPEFLTYFLITGLARFQIQRDARGSSGSMVKISQGHVLNWQAPIPPLVEQIGIVGQIKAAEIKSKSLINDLVGSITLLKERRAALITAAVTGQIPLEEMRA